MNETATRLLTAAIIAPFSVWMLVLGGWIWAGYAGLAALICLTEFFHIMESKGHKPMRWIAMATTVALIGVAQMSGIELAAGILTGGILALLVYQVTSPVSGSAISNISSTMTGVLYVGWMLSHGVYLRNLLSPDESIHLGVFAVLFTMATTFLNDTGAYFVGRAFGKHPVAPTISPKKTWEGLIGGVVTSGLSAIAIGWITQQWFHPVPYSYVFLFIAGLLIGIVGFFGDLVESLLKRDADVKDSGSLLPGHGGLLDRIDGILFTLPFAYYMFVVANQWLSR